MLEKPDLPDAEIAALLATRYGLAAPRPIFLPKGNDAGAWAYRVESEQGLFFLKLRQGPIYEPALTVPRFLHERGIRQVVAPLPARAGVLRVRSGSYTLALYPYIEDQRPSAGLTPEQWAGLGETTRRIHAARLPRALLRQMRFDSFHPPWAAEVTRLQARVRQGPYDSPQQEDLARFWRPRSAEIARITTRAEALGHLLREQALPRVLCHGDLHESNLILDPQGQVGIVDWDNCVVAPRERDLMFLTGPDPRQSFFRGAGTRPGYGEVRLSALALAYYSYEWVVQELGDYGQRVFPGENVSSPENVRVDAVQGIRALFEPGNVVESAYQADRALSV